MTAPTVLLRDSPGDPKDSRWLAFDQPREVLVAETPADVPGLLASMRKALDDGRWLAGYFAYDAAPAFDPGFAAWPARDGEPVAWWGVFDRSKVWAEDPTAEPAARPESNDEPDWRPTMDREAHRRAVEAAREAIARGDTYQVNLTFQLEADWQHDAFGLFRRLVRGQRPGYAAWVDTGALAVASASPELFFRCDPQADAGGLRVVARPMKGTAPRGRWPEEDAARRGELASAKNRAENLMIVDMTRNDLGRIAVPGTVRVRELFGVETYPTVHQLTSEVVATAEEQVTAIDVLSALFPCASITGAPKARTTQIIRSLETGPRGVYTGAVGYFAPGGAAQLNVAIRTAVVDRRRGVARYGTGGGIVWDSRPASEYDEARTKARVLVGRSAEPPADVRLLETMLWRPRSGYFLLDRHLRRLAESARHLGYAGGPEGFDLDEVLRRVDGDLASICTGWTGRTRVRLLVARSGEIEIQAVPEDCPRVSREVAAAVPRVVLDDRPVDEEDPSLFHKTTHRRVYEEARARHPGAHDVLLWNRRGELTESTLANLVVKMPGASPADPPRWLTPARRCGLLAGTYRQALLERGRLRESVLRPDDLGRAQAVFLINSVRGWTRVELGGATRTDAPEPPEERPASARPRVAAFEFG